MTSPHPSAIKPADLEALLAERIAQLESREENPPRNPDEQAADDAFQVAATAARALVADTEIAGEEKVRVLQAMFADCVNNVRHLEYDLGIEEKRLSIAELDYNELGEDLKKIEALTEKLKTLSRELSKQNKSMMEDSERRTAEERRKREEIVAKFDEAMKDINARLNTSVEVEDERDDAVSELETDLERLQKEYEKREVRYESQLGTETAAERAQTDRLREAEEIFQRDELAIVTERRRLVDLNKRSRMLIRDLEMLDDKRLDVEETVKERQEDLEGQQAELKRLQQSELDLSKAGNKLARETEEMRDKTKKAIAKVKADEEELEFWRAKSKGELEKKETLERLYNTLTEERTVMRQEVQAMQAIWTLLEQEIENLRLKISETADT